MEEKELLEIEAKESAQARKNIEEMVRTKKMSDIGLLYRDKFDLEDKKVLFSGDRDVPKQHLIPICDKLLLAIAPLATADVFESHYGFSVKQVVEWRKKRWIETVLAGSYDEYADLQYLDPLIEVSPSRSNRNQVYLAVLAGGVNKFNELLNKGQTLFRNLRASDRMRRYFGERRADEMTLAWTAANYVDLSVLGLTPVVERAEEMIRQDAELDGADTLLLSSVYYLTSPFTKALKRTTVYPSEERSEFEMFHGTEKYVAEPLFVPCWLADVYENLGATIPQTMNTDEVDAVRKHSEDFVLALKNMDEEIDKTVREKFSGGELNRGEKETIIAKKEEFRKRWFDDVVPAFKDLSKRERYWSIGMTGSIIAPALALPAFTGVLGIPPALAALAASDKIKKLVDPAAEFLSTFFECNPIHLGFYKVHREIGKVRQRSDRS